MVDRVNAIKNEKKNLERKIKRGFKNNSLGDLFNESVKIKNIVVC